MYALTIYQPWASLIMAGVKPFEFRGWQGRKRLIGQRIVIHAAAAKVRRRDIRRLLDKLAVNVELSFLAGADGEQVDRAVHYLKRWLDRPELLPTMVALGTATFGVPLSPSQFYDHVGLDRFGLDRTVIANARWAWPMADPQPFDIPVPAKGRQGFWRWPAVVEMGDAT